MTPGLDTSSVGRHRVGLVRYQVPILPIPGSRMVLSSTEIGIVQYQMAMYLYYFIYTHTCSHHTDIG